MRTKVKRTGKNGEEIIYSTRFTTILLSNLVSNLAEGIHKMKCKCGFEDKKNVKPVELNTKVFCLEYTSILPWIHTYVKTSDILK